MTSNMQFIIIVAVSNERQQEKKYWHALEKERIERESGWEYMCYCMKDREGDFEVWYIALTHRQAWRAKERTREIKKGMEREREGERSSFRERKRGRTR